MAKYYVAVEAFRSSSFGAFAGFPGFQVEYLTVNCEPPINEQVLWEAINKDREHKTGNIIAWSKIEEAVDIGKWTFSIANGTAATIGKVNATTTTRNTEGQVCVVLPNIEHLNARTDEDKLTKRHSYDNIEDYKKYVVRCPCCGIIMDFGKDDVYIDEDSCFIRHEYYIDCPECNKKIQLNDKFYFWISENK